MKNYLITGGSYSYYKVYGLLTGPDDLAIPRLWEAFQRLWDHGMHAYYAEYNSDVLEHCAEIRSWRAAQPWARGERSALPPHAFMLHGPEENFIGWLVLEHGCQEVTCEEAHLEDD